MINGFSEKKVLMEQIVKKDFVTGITKDKSRCSKRKKAIFMRNVPLVEI